MVAELSFAVAALATHAPRDGNRVIIGAMKLVNPDIDWQANMLAAKVLKRALGLDAASRELDDWQGDDKSNGAYRKVDSRALIVTHALNTLLKRGY
jgi:hypothetical protein